MSIDPSHLPTPVAAAFIVACLFLTAVAVIKGWPVFWKFLCLPARLEERLQKLDGLDGIKDDANAALEEWKGATQAVRDLTDNHNSRITALESWRKRIDAERRTAKSP